MDESLPSESGSDVGQDAVSLLSADHEEVRQLFEEYDDLVDREASDEDKQEVADEICILLTVHASLEEEIFYPAAREAVPETKDHVLESVEEHHVAEEEGQLFPALIDEATLDLDAIGAQLERRKLELMADVGLEQDS